MFMEEIIFIQDIRTLFNVTAYLKKAIFALKSVIKVSLIALCKILLNITLEIVDSCKNSSITCAIL